MEIRRPTRLVALDTEVFKAANFNYESASFQQLIELSEAGQIYIYLTTVIHKEVLSHIHREIESA